MKKYIEPKLKVFTGELSNPVAQIYQGSVDEQLGKERDGYESDVEKETDSWNDGLW